MAGLKNSVQAYAGKIVRILTPTSKIELIVSENTYVEIEISGKVRRYLIPAVENTLILDKDWEEKEKKKEEILNCQNCGYEGKESEFLDHGCPKCGA